MSKYKQRQALATPSRLSPQVLPGYPAGEIAGLEAEAAKVVAADAAARRNGGAGGHIVIDRGRLSGLIRDAHTTVRFAGGAVAVTTRD